MTAFAVYRLKEGSRDFVVKGLGQEWKGYLFYGGMKDDVFWGLKGLELLPARQRVVNKWKALAPRVAGGVKNTGLDRRFVEFQSDTSPNFMLRFDHYVPPDLLRELRAAFGDKTEELYNWTKKKGEGDGRRQEGACDREGNQEDPAADSRGDRAGKLQRPARHAAGARQDPHRKRHLKKRRTKIKEKT